jgi:hypothetical protein
MQPCAALKQTVSGPVSSVLPPRAWQSVSQHLNGARRHRSHVISFPDSGCVKLNVVVVVVAVTGPFPAGVSIFGRPLFRGVTARAATVWGLLCCPGHKEVQRRREHNGAEGSRPLYFYAHRCSSSYIISPPTADRYFYYRQRQTTKRAAAAN